MQQHSTKLTQSAIVQGVEKQSLCESNKCQIFHKTHFRCGGIFKDDY